MTNNWVENARLMDELYEKDFGSKDAVSKQETKEEGNIFLGILLLPFLFLDLLIRTFITEPKSNWNPKAHFFVGLIKFFTYAFVLYSTLYIGNVVESIISSEGLVVFTKAFIVIFSMIQVFYGISIAGGWFHEASGMSLSSGGGSRGSFTPRERDIINNASNSQSYSDNSNEIDETFRYMNAKMGGMSNRKKEEYLGKFYGGGK